MEISEAVNFIYQTNIFKYWGIFVIIAVIAMIVLSYIDKKDTGECSNGKLSCNSLFILCIIALTGLIVGGYYCIKEYDISKFKLVLQNPVDITIVYSIHQDPIVRLDSFINYSISDTNFNIPTKQIRLVSGDAVRFLTLLNNKDLNITVNTLTINNTRSE